MWKNSTSILDSCIICEFFFVEKGIHWISQQRRTLNFFGKCRKKISLNQNSGPHGLYVKKLKHKNYKNSFGWLHTNEALIASRDASCNWLGEELVPICSVTCQIYLPAYMNFNLLWVVATLFTPFRISSHDFEPTHKLHHQLIEKLNYMGIPIMTRTSSKKIKNKKY